MQPDVHSYSQRLLNPFRGIVAIVEYENARALSLDGLNWRIQVKTRPPHHMWGGAEEHDKKQFFNFGSWTLKNGLDAVPLNPILNTVEMIQAAEPLIDDLPDQIKKLPFPLTDRYELWLLDANTQQPFALLASTSERSHLPELTPKSPVWIATSADDASFVSQTLKKQGILNQDESSDCQHAEALNQLIQQRAYPGNSLQCYKRTAHGIQLVNPANKKQSTPTDNENIRIPELPLETRWPRTEDRELVADYIDWLAPRLLTLDKLKSGDRDRLERAAVTQPREVDRFWRLYPEIINKELLTRARVEAKILNAG